MKILIVEDEDFAAKRLEKLVNEVLTDKHQINFTRSVKETIDYLMSDKPDLIFMDIQLSDGVSFKVFEQLEVSTPVIFTTAYDQYAIKAFETNSVAYLLKPIRKQELEKAITKFQQIFEPKQTNMMELWQKIRSGETPYKQRFLAQRGEKLYYVQTENIAYFYVIQKDVYATTFDNKTYALDASLEAVNEQIDPNKFFRINRQYIVQLKAIESMVARSRGRIKLNLEPPVADSEETVVSVNRSADFKSWLDR
jgi:DNA-binding LytR/AlgR family response regulator